LGPDRLRRANLGRRGALASTPESRDGGRAAALRPAER
jgi:hypothetical protein